MLLVYVIILVYVALNLHKFYLNKHTVLQFAFFGQRFCLGDLYILITQLQCLYFNCSRARHYIPYSPYPFPTDGNLAQVFFIFCNLLLVFFFFLYKQCCIEILVPFPEAQSSFSCCRENAETLHSRPNASLKPPPHAEHTTKCNESCKEHIQRSPAWEKLPVCM